MYQKNHSDLYTIWVYTDLSAFENSSLKTKLETLGFLTDWLYIFGDNAYVNRFYMATLLYPNVSGYNLQQDNYNFYHSQLQIKIECAFGILVQRFGYLRKKAGGNETYYVESNGNCCLYVSHTQLVNW